MTKGEKGMGETLTKVAKECKMIVSRHKWIKLRNIPGQVSIGSTRISNASIVNVADEEKQESLPVMTSMKD